LVGDEVNQVKSAISSRQFSIDTMFGFDDEAARVVLRIAHDDIVVKSADFLAAVAKECEVRITAANTEPLADRELELLAGPGKKFVPADALVIERGKLPVILADDASYFNSAPADYRARGLRYLAVAAYKEAHPTVDEAAVEALLRAVAPGATYGRDTSAEAWARKAIVAGYGVTK
jgi:hypothetical protein